MLLFLSRPRTLTAGVSPYSFSTATITVSRQRNVRSPAVPGAGELCGRLYTTTMSENSGSSAEPNQTAGIESGSPSQRTDACGSHGARSDTHRTSTRSETVPTKSESRKQPPTQPPLPKSRPAPRANGPAVIGRNIYNVLPERRQDSQGLTGEPPRRSPSRLSPLAPASEDAIARLIGLFMNHDHLAREIGRQLTTNRHLLRMAVSEGDKSELNGQIEVLERLRNQISNYYFPPPPPSPPPPRYTSSEHPAALNKQLREVFDISPPPRNILSRICYHILSSPSLPNLITYNILIQGFTKIGQNGLAHLVFHNLSAQAPVLKPDTYTLIAMVNLCVKCGDYGLYGRLVRLIHSNRRAPENRSQALIEAMIVGAAKFGQEGRIRAYIRTFNDTWPGRKPATYALTAVLGFFTEKRDWMSGKRTWSQIDLEKRDETAYYQMLKLCEACGKETHRPYFLKEALRRGLDERGILNPEWRVEAGRERGLVEIEGPLDILSRTRLLQLQSLKDTLDEAIERWRVEDRSEAGEEDPADGNMRNELWSRVLTERVWYLKRLVDEGAGG